MADISTVVPPRLLEDDSFKKDASGLIGLSTARLSALRALVSHDTALSTVETKLTDGVVEELGVDRVTAGRLLYTLHFFMLRLAENPSISPQEFIDGVIERLGLSVEAGHRAALIAAVKPSEEQRLDRTEREAFAFGDTYLGTSIVPVFTHGSDEVLYGGASVSISIQKPDGTRGSVSFNASSIELQEMAETFLEAKRGIDAALARLREKSP